MTDRQSPAPGPTGGFPASGLIGVINLSREKPGTLRYADGVDGARRLAAEYRDAGFRGIDLGAQSSHYAVRTMSANEQIALLVPVIETLHDEYPIAVETALPEVIRACADAGAHCVNLSGGVRDDAVLDVVAATSLACITSFTPRDSPQDVAAVDIEKDLKERYLRDLADNVARLEQHGIDHIIVDAGVGFSYQMPYADFSKYQVETIRGTRRLGQTLRRPTLVAVPRIADEWRVAAFAALAIESGASLLRCHDPDVGGIADLLGFDDEQTG